MKRREFIALLGGAASWPLAARGQQRKMLRVGFVGMQPRAASHYANFLKRMAEFGYEEGRNFTFDYIQTPDVERDIAPIASIYRAPAVLVVHPSFPAKSVPALIAYAKANPGKINTVSAARSTCTASCSR